METAFEAEKNYMWQEVNEEQGDEKFKFSYFHNFHTWT